MLAPAVAAAAHHLAALHREVDLRRAGIAGDRLEFGAEQLVDEIREDHRIGLRADRAHRHFLLLGIVERVDAAGVPRVDACRWSSSCCRAIAAARLRIWRRRRRATGTSAAFWLTAAITVPSWASRHRRNWRRGCCRRPPCSAPPHWDCPACACRDGVRARGHRGRSRRRRRIRRRSGWSCPCRNRRRVCADAGQVAKSRPAAVSRVLANALDVILLISSHLDRGDRGGLSRLRRPGSAPASPGWGAPRARSGPRPRTASPPGTTSAAPAGPRD